MYTHIIQLSYRESLQEGAAVRVPFPDTEGGFIDLAVGRCVEAAVKLLRPTQENQSVDAHYRQQAWNILQVRICRLCRAQNKDSEVCGQNCRT